MSAVQEFDIHAALWAARNEIHALRLAFNACAPDSFSRFLSIRGESFQPFPEFKFEAARNRKIADCKGEKKYAGMPCKHGHVGLRYVSTTACVECAILAGWQKQ